MTLVSEERQHAIGPSNTQAGQKQLAIVQWSGELGGAESLAATLGRVWRDLGVDARIVFVGDPFPLADRLDRLGIPYSTAGINPGRGILWSPRRFAACVRLAGADGALLPDCGYMAGVLRGGGYQARLVGVDHGFVLRASDQARLTRIRRSVERWAGARFRSIDVGVSDFVLERLGAAPHAARLKRIHNFVDPDLIDTPAVPLPSSEDGLTIGLLGRLVPGKGFESAFRATQILRRRFDVRLLVGGDGPARTALEALARELGLNHVVDFCGVVTDSAAFWDLCHVAVVPTDRLQEAFGLAALEAMARARPVVATTNGGLPEIVLEGVTGSLVPRGNADALARALATYLTDLRLAEQRGSAGRRRAVEQFDPVAGARAYLDLFTR